MAYHDSQDGFYTQQAEGTRLHLTPLHAICRHCVLSRIESMFHVQQFLKAGMSIFSDTVTEGPWLA